MAKKRAILIGINQYESSSLNNLKYAKADAEAMKQCLEREGSFDPNGIFLFTEDSSIHHHSNISTKATFCNLLFFFDQQFKKTFLSKEDQLWFFFSGHGMRGTGGDYLIPSDGHPELVNKTAIAVNYITERLRKSGAGNVVMFLDACRYEAGHKGTIKLENYQGTITFYSCSAGQRSYEIDERQQGAFTYVLLEALQKDKEITVSELDKYLMEGVPHLKSNQRPLASVQPIGKKDLYLLGKPPNIVTNKVPKYQEKNSQRQQKIITLITAVVTIPGLIFIGIWWATRNNCPPGQIKANGNCIAILPTNLNDLSERFSSGEHTLLKNFYNNPSLDLGTKNFAKKNYKEAFNSFKQAIKIEKENRQQYRSAINPESQIYFNNTKARLNSPQNNPFVLAVVVTASGLPLEGAEMLRGIADAQREFNSTAGIKSRLLEIVIVNDDNDPDIASQVAQKVADNKNILGVIGHHTSESSKAGIPKYEKAGLAMVSPLSTSSDLSSRVFLRTVASTKEMANKLSDHAKAHNINKVAIFYNSDSVYSKSMSEDFVEAFSEKGVLENINIKDQNLGDKLKNLQGKVDAIVLFPQAELKSFEISYDFAKDNRELLLYQQIKLLGGNSLYRNEILTLWKDAFEGLVLVIPWFADTPSAKIYATEAKKEWGGQIGWRTATSYDATQAFIEALRLSVDKTGNVTRASLLEKLKSVKLPPSKTSGEELSFLDSGNRQKMTPALVKVVKKGSNLNFERIR